MQKRVTMFAFVLLLFGFGYGVVATLTDADAPTDEQGNLAGGSFTENEAGFDPEPVSPTTYRVGAGNRYSLDELAAWERPSGPPRVGLQVGHWQNDQVPEELKNLTQNGGGAAWGSFSEREVVYEIVELAATALRAAGVEVDVLPATVPPGYVADAFISVHADGNPNELVNGFKIAGPRRDYAGTSEALVAALYESYGSATGLREDPTITRRMTAYYAFNWPRYEHAVHPFTPAAIVETGFLTSAIDRAIIVAAPERAAAGIVEGVLAFLAATSTPQRIPTSITPPALPITSVVTCAPLRTERLNRSEQYDCVPAVTAANGASYILADYTSSTAPMGTTVAVRGTFRPVQTIDSYFWYPYEVAGFIEASTVSPSPAFDG